MQLVRIEPEHLLYANELRNKYLIYLRQPFPHNRSQQLKWLESTSDIYWAILDDANELCGVIGITNIDLVNKKAELSLITEDYLIKEHADFALYEIEKYAFGKLSLHKLFITVYEFDEKKTEYFNKRYKFSHRIFDDVYYNGKFWGHDYYYKIRG